MEVEEAMLDRVREEYSYDVPLGLIAEKGAEPRDSARMLVYDRASKETRLARFSDLPVFLDENVVLVFNETKVIPARLRAIARDQSPIEITVTRMEDGEVETLSSRGARKLLVGEEVAVHGTTFKVKKRDERFTYYATGMSSAEMLIFLNRFGEAPLPPYIKHTPLSKEEVQERYQSVFAKNEGSVAAPTASLHFSHGLLHALQAQGVGVEFVTLHVGLGTFLPLSEDNLRDGVLHAEEYFIDKDTARRINDAKKSGRRIIPVGTTSLRTLESAANPDGELVFLEDATRLFIRPGHHFRVADGLVTNFHVPCSSLLMLVDAFLGESGAWRALYERAIQERFRLFSFGDGMLIL